MQEKDKRYHRGMLVALGVSALAVGVLVGSAQAAAPADNVSSPDASSTDGQAGVAYWTRERMAAAKPREVMPPQHSSAPVPVPETADPAVSVPPAARSKPQETAVDPADNVSSPDASSTDAQAGVAYWTRERMAAAKPREVTPSPETAAPPVFLPPAEGSEPPETAPTPSGPPQPLTTTPAPKAPPR